MIDKAMWEALWQLYPVDMTIMCAVVAMIVVVAVVCIVEFLRVCLMNNEKEDELWVN